MKRPTRRSLLKSAAAAIAVAASMIGITIGAEANALSAADTKQRSMDLQIPAAAETYAASSETLSGNYFIQCYYKTGVWDIDTTTAGTIIECQEPDKK